MNTLKPLLIVAVLAAIGYGVYVRINNGHDGPPPGVAAGWDAAPQVQLPDGAAAGGVPPWSGGSASSAIAPPFAVPHAQAPGSAAPSEAPPYNPSAPAGDGGAYNPSAIPGGPPTNGGGVPAYPPVGPPPPAANDPLAGAPIPPEPGTAGPTAPNQYGDYPRRDAGAASQGPPGPPAAPPSAYDAQGAQTYRSIPASNPPGVEPAVSGEVAMAIDRARRDLEAGQLASALRQLSSWYEDPRLAPPQKQQLNLLLDQVAGTVVYSTQHLLESPYEVQPGERLEDISQRYNVPWQLLAKINGIEDPQSLRGGERLKVIRGPFGAVVSLEKRQLTLLLSDGSYAGRFAIGIGRDHPPQEGVYVVSDKVANPVYHGRDQSIGGGDANNPLGGRWIGLGTELGIHGTNRPDMIGRNDLPGSISLSPRDVDDVYDILSVGSRVTIRR